MEKKILIIGNSAKEYALAKKMSKACEVFVAPGNIAMKEFATTVDIREDSVAELLEFVMENGIDLTIPVSRKAMLTNIVDLFNKNNLQIFAPNSSNVSLLSDKAYMKKLLYKLKIPTPRFAIFEKQNLATDYIKNAKTPFVIKTNEASSAVVLTSQKTAKVILDSNFAQHDQKVIIEDYVWGTPFCFYVISDGYKALPLGSSILYKYSLEGDGGQLTSGMGACSPNYKLSFENEDYIMESIVNPLLSYFENNGEPYLGILGVNAILTEEGEIQVIGLETFMQDSDCSAIINLLDTDILSLIESCVLGIFSDEIDYISQKDLSAISLVLMCKNKDNSENSISGLEYLDETVLVDFYSNINKNKYLEYEAITGPVLVLTALASTTTSAIAKIYDEAESIDFKGIYYRKDICKPLVTSV